MAKVVRNWVFVVASHVLFFPNDRDTMSAMSFCFQAMDTVMRGDTCVTCCRMARARRSFPATFDFLDAIFADQATVGVLS